MPLHPGLDFRPVGFKFRAILGAVASENDVSGHGFLLSGLDHRSGQFVVNDDELDDPLAAD
jgi:hypothetical protein